MALVFDGGDPDSCVTSRGKPGATGRARMNSKRIWLRVLIVIAAIVLVAVVVVGIWVARLGFGAIGDLMSGARSLKGELAAARREGLPLEASDLRPDPPVPAHRNAAPFLKEMAKLYWAQSETERNGTGDITTALGSASRSDADREMAREWLQRRAKFVELAEKAAGRPDCDMEKPYELGPYVQFREFPAAREAARLLSIRATLASDAGRYRQAFRDVALGARIGHHVGREPIIIALLVRVAIDAIMDRAFVNTLLDHIRKPDAVRIARETLRSFGRAPDIEHGCRGEAVMSRVAVDIVRSGKDIASLTGSEPPPTVSRALSSRGAARLFCDASEARIVSYWRRAFSRLRQHRGDYMAQGAAFDDLDREMQAHAQAKASSYILLAILTPVFSRMADKVALNDAQRRMREGLVRIAEYRLRVGRLPETLAEVGGTPLLDPFSGKPLMYQRTARGFVLYSVGENRKDDGGNGRRPPAGGSAPDIVIEYPKPASAIGTGRR